MAKTERHWTSKQLPLLMMVRCDLKDYCWSVEEVVMTDRSAVPGNPLRHLKKSMGQIL